MLAFKRRRDGNVSYLEAREHPLVIQQLRIIDALRKWLVEFGATPASRTQMREDGKGGRGAAPPPVDPFEAYLARKRG
jgi:hypothetical protein